MVSVMAVPAGVVVGGPGMEVTAAFPGGAQRHLFTTAQRAGVLRIMRGGQAVWRQVPVHCKGGQAFVTARARVLAPARGLTSRIAGRHVMPAQLRPVHVLAAVVVVAVVAVMVAVVRVVMMRPVSRGCGLLVVLLLPLVDARLEPGLGALAASLVAAGVGRCKEEEEETSVNAWRAVRQQRERSTINREEEGALLRRKRRQLARNQCRTTHRHNATAHRCSKKRPRPGCACTRPDRSAGRSSGGGEAGVGWGSPEEDRCSWGEPRLGRKPARRTACRARENQHSPAKARRVEDVELMKNKHEEGSMACACVMFCHGLS